MSGDHKINNGEVLIAVSDLKKAFGNHVVLDGITTEIRKGEVVVIIGPSGSGKSTFLRCLNLLEEADRRIIFTVDGEWTSQIRRQTSIRCAKKWEWCSSSLTCFHIKRLDRILCLRL